MIKIKGRVAINIRCVTKAPQFADENSNTAKFSLRAEESVVRTCRRIAIYELRVKGKQEHRTTLPFKE